MSQCHTISWFQSVFWLMVYQLPLERFSCEAKIWEPSFSKSYLCLCDHQLGNSVANDFAIDVCRHHMSHLSKQYEATHATLTLEKTHLFGLYKYLLQDLLRISKQEDQQTHSVQQAELVEGLDLCTLFLERLAPNVWDLQPSRATKWEDSTWGRSIMRSLYHWLQHCKWPKVQSPEDTYGVTCLCRNACLCRKACLCRNGCVVSCIFLPHQEGNPKDGISSEKAKLIENRDCGKSDKSKSTWIPCG